MAMVLDRYKSGLLIAIVFLIALGLWVSRGAKPLFVVLATLASVVLLILFVKLIKGVDNKFIFNLAIAALIIRIVVVFALHYTNLSHEADALFYHAQAVRISANWIRLMPFEQAMSSAYGYIYFLSFLYSGFVPVSLIAKLINCFVGVACGLYVYKIAYLVWEDKKVANIAAVLALFLPGILAWSTANLKEAWVNLMVLIVIFDLLRIRKAGVRTGVIIQIVACTAILWTMRFYLALIMLPLIVFTIGVGKRKSIIYLSIVFILVAYGAIFMLAGRKVQGVTIGYQEIGMRQGALAQLGGSATGEEGHIENFSSALAFLPKGMLYALFAPFPWDKPASALYALAMPEMFFMYLLWILIFMGIVKSIRERKKGIEVIMFFAITTLLLNSMLMGNIGTSYRARMPIVLLMLVFAAGVFEERKDKPVDRQSGY